MVNHLVNWLSPLKERSTVGHRRAGLLRRRHAHRRPDLLRQRRDRHRVGGAARVPRRRRGRHDPLRHPEARAAARRARALPRRGARARPSDIVTLRQGLRTVEVGRGRAGVRRHPHAPSPSRLPDRTEHRHLTFLDSHRHCTAIAPQGLTRSDRHARRQRRARRLPRTEAGALGGRGRLGRRSCWASSPARRRCAPGSSVTPRSASSACKARMLDPRPSTCARAPIRRPLAYPADRVAEFRTQQVKAWRAEPPGPRRRARTGEDRPRSAPPRGQVWLAARRGARQGRQPLGEAALAARPGSCAASADRPRPSTRRPPRFWLTTMGDRAWRRLDPSLWDFELAYGPVIDELEPDIDPRQRLPDARRRRPRDAPRPRGRAAPVKLVWDAHEFLPGITPWRDNPRWLPAHVAHEREYAPYADAVVTVSDDAGRAAAARRTACPSARPSCSTRRTPRPPTPATPVAGPARRCAASAPDAPLLVYSGVGRPRSAASTSWSRRCPELPGVHVALRGRPPDAAVHAATLDDAGRGARRRRPGARAAVRAALAGRRRSWPRPTSASSRSTTGRTTRSR